MSLSLETTTSHVMDSAATESHDTVSHSGGSRSIGHEDGRLLRRVLHHDQSVYPHYIRGLREDVGGVDRQGSPGLAQEWPSRVVTSWTPSMRCSGIDQCLQDDHVMVQASGKPEVEVVDMREQQESEEGPVTPREARQPARQADCEFFVLSPERADA